MKKFVYSAIALSMATGVSYANNGWTSLDQEISGLSSSLTAQNAGGPKVGGWIITSVASQKAATTSNLDTIGDLSDPADGDFNDADEDGDDDGFDAADEGENDNLGFKLNQVRLHITGDLSNDYSYKISFDLNTDDGAVLQDAYARWKFMDGVNFTMGRFRNATLTSSLREENTQMFLDRTIAGSLFDNRDEGFMVSGNFSMLNYWVAVQNGNDGTEDDLDISVRVAADVMGKGAGSVEGAYGAAEGTNLTVGAFMIDMGAGRSDMGTLANLTVDGEEASISGTADAHFGLDAYFTMGTISVAGEYVSATTTTGTDLEVDGDDTTVYALTASWMFTEMYEGAIRYQSLDAEALEGTLITVGVNRYSAGHNLKWTLQYTTEDSTYTYEGDERDVNSEDEIAVGLTVAF